MNRHFVDKELYDNTEANFNDLTIRYEHLEKVADERMSTILDIEKYCIDEKEDLISGCEVCEDILKMIDKLKDKKYYIKKTYIKRQRGGIMNNEIKEILDYLDYGVNSLSISKPPFKIEYEDIKKLLDYITNLQQENKILKENYERIYNENCILREKHNINDIGLLDENYKLKQIIDKAIDKLYCWGEALNPTFQKELLDILKEVE